MSTSTFTLAEVLLLEESVASHDAEVFRKIKEQDRIPTSSPTIHNQVKASKESLSKTQDDLAMIRAKLITLRSELNSPSEETPEE